MQVNAVTRGAAVLAAIAILFLAGTADAQQKRPAGPAAKPVDPGVAKKFINDMGDKAVKTLAIGTKPQRDGAFTNLMVEAIDFDSLAGQTLGKLARTAKPTDRAAFAQLFAAYVIDVAIEKFGTTQVENFKIGELKPQPNGDIKVHTLVNRKGDTPLNVDWRVRDTNGKPRINDIEVEGYSLVIHYRGEFERAGVSTVPGLIKRLEELTKTSPALPTVKQAMK